MHVAGRLYAHQRHQRAGVDTARQEDAERHVGHQPAPHRTQQAPAQLLAHLVHRTGSRPAALEPPVAARRWRGGALAIEQRCSRRQFLDPSDDAAGSRHVLVSHEVVERLDIPLQRHPWRHDHRLELRPEDDALWPIVDVERLDAQPVAGEEELLAPPIPDGKPEHAVEPSHAVRSPLLVGVDDRLGVAARAEAVAAGLQLGPQLGVVVDLAVEDDLDRTVLVGHRLVPPGEVDDAQPAHPDGQAAFHPVALVVRAPVR